MLHRIAHALKQSLRGIIGMALAIALAASIAAPVLADTTTGNISGTVTTAAGQGVPNVDVVAVAPAGRYTARTDAKGFFSIIGVSPDTYSVTFSASGYSGSTVNGVTVNPTQTTTVNSTVSAQLKTIGSTTSRAPGVSAFQPQQPVDTYSVNANQITTLLGKPHATSETALLISLPGASLDKGGYPVLRGGRENDEGFQFEGIDYTDAFTNQFVNNLRLNGVANFQLTPGAGDPSLGNTGTGAINATVKRGSYPHFGSAEVDVAGPLFQHFGTAEYGFATPNGRFSSYNTYNAREQRQLHVRPLRRRRQHDRLPADVQLLPKPRLHHEQRAKVRQGQRQSVQLFYQNSMAEFTANNNFGRNTYRVGDPGVRRATSSRTSSDSPTTQRIEPFSGRSHRWRQARRTTARTRETRCIPQRSASLAQTLNRPPNSQLQPNETMKLQYSNALNSSTFFTVKLYKVNATAIFDQPDAAPAALAFGGTDDAYVLQGGQRTGFAIDLTKQLGTKHLLGFGGKYEFIHPIDSFQSASVGVLAAAFGGNDFAVRRLLTGVVRRIRLPCAVLPGWCGAAYPVLRPEPDDSAQGLRLSTSAISSKRLTS